jgi:hypothetical protein
MESTMIDKKYGDKPIHFEVSLGKLFVGGYWVIEIPLLINIDENVLFVLDQHA